MLRLSANDFEALKKSVFQALFLTGIPFFAYVNFVDSVNFGAFSFFISSFLCSFSISNLNVFFERKNLFYLVLNMTFFMFGLLFTHIFSGNNLIFSFIYILIYLNWISYYIIRKIMLFPDVLLHITGGVLIFFLGLIWGVDEKNMKKLFDFIFDNEKLLLSFFVSFAFTAGYIIDLIDDIEEDRKIGQKNLSEKIGIKLTFLFSSFLFLVSYISGFFVIKQNISKIIFLLLFLTHTFVAIILFLNHRIPNLIPKYRHFYRFLFVIYCILITFDKQKIQLPFLF